MSQTKGPVKHIDLLDYARGIAILAVLAYHSLGAAYGHWALPWNDDWTRKFSVPTSFLCFLPLSFGSTGVAIFFVVSGFCIHLSFQQQGQKWKSFFIRRFSRLYPAYFVSLIFFALLYASHSKFDANVWRTSLTHLFLVFNYVHDDYLSFNGSFWSLAVEAQLYLIYPVLLFLVAKTGWKRTLTLVGIIEFLIRGAYGIVQVMPNTDFWNNLYDAVWKCSNSPFGYWFSWSIGAYLADAFLKNEPLPFRNFLAMPILWLAVGSYFIRPVSTFMFPLFALLTAIVLGKSLAGAKPVFKMPSMTLALLKKIGLWSYSIYLLHEPLVRVYAFAFGWFIPLSKYREPIVLFLVFLTWFTVIVFSILWYKLFELPGIAIGKKIIARFDAGNARKFEPQRTQENRRTGFASFWWLSATVIILVVLNCWLNAKFAPLSPEENNNLAWSLATNPDPAKRDGARAVKLAEEACRQTEGQQPFFFGTLGAAYAETGRFDDAAAAARQAIALATQQGNQALAERNQQLLALYLNHQAYREQPTNQPAQKY